MLAILTMLQQITKNRSNTNQATVVDNNGVLKNEKIVVPLKYLSNFWRSLEILLINCKIHLELSWTNNCVMSSVAVIIEFKITNTKLYVPIVNLSTEDNVKLTKQLSERFKRSVY